VPGTAKALEGHLLIPARGGLHSSLPHNGKWGNGGRHHRNSCSVAASEVAVLVAGAHQSVHDAGLLGAVARVCSQGVAPSSASLAPTHTDDDEEHGGGGVLGGGYRERPPARTTAAPCAGPTLAVVVVVKYSRSRSRRSCRCSRTGGSSISVNQPTNRTRVSCHLAPASWRAPIDQ
jgi:hypothetical protein